MSDGPSGHARLWLVAKLVAAVLVVIAPVWGRAFAEGRAELAAAQDARADGRPDEAIVHFGRAARWRTPLAGHDERAVSELLAIGDDAVASGDQQRALDAFRQVRGALLATRVWRVSQAAALDRANDGIAAIMARQEQLRGTDVGGTGDPERFHRELLEDVPGPNPALSTLASVLFVAFVVCVVGMFRYGLDEQGKPVPRHAVRLGLGIVVALVGWLVALRMS